MPNTDIWVSTPHVENKLAVNTRRKRYSGGPETQDPGRNRREELPAPNERYGLGLDLNNEQLVEIDPQGNGASDGSVDGHNAQPTPSGSRETRAVGVQRMRWSNELNKDIMRSYYKVTKGETDLTMYRHKLHEDLLQKRPELGTISEQRIADQRRTIIIRNLLPPPVIEQIKDEVRNELEQRNRPQQINEAQNTNEPEMEAPLTGTNATKEDHTSRQLQTLWMSCFEASIIQYTGIDPCRRPKLPKIRYKPTTKELTTIANEKLGATINQRTTLEEIHFLIYCAAVATITMNGQKLTNEQSTEHEANRTPRWERRLQTKVDDLRQKIGRTQQIINGNWKAKLIKTLPGETQEQLRSLNKKEALNNIVDYHDTLKQRLAVVAHRLARYRKSKERKQQNIDFQKSQKLFYRSLENPTAQIVTPPRKDTLKEFWSGVWSVPFEHNDDVHWIRKEASKYEDQKMRPIIFTKKDLTEACKRLANWKAPGQDGVQNYWLKTFTSAHKYIAEAFNAIIAQPHLMPTFMTKGITHLLAKSADTQNPSQYRPITCLPTLYKLFSAILCNKVYYHLEENQILTMEQKGCRRRAMGCKEQAIVDSIILEQARTKCRNLHMGYVDYQKAFDSIPHSWLLKVLQIYGIDPKVVHFFKETMKRWTTRLQLKTEGGIMKIEEIQLKRGIFQGDSFSALWFCLALNPLSRAIQDSQYGFNLKTARGTQLMNHLFYMDDLKLYAATRNQLELLMKLVHRMSSDIGMTFGISKCQTVTVTKGKLKEGTELQLEDGKIVSAMSDDPYKYLGYLQTNRIEHKTIKEKMREKFKTRLILILKTKLNSQKLTKAINTYAIPTLAYSFGVIHWSRTELEEINRLIRTKMTAHRKHHPQASKTRINLPRPEGGRGIFDLVQICNKQIQTLRKYFLNSQIYKTIRDADTKLTPLNLNSLQYSPFPDVKSNQQKIEELRSKELHGRFQNDLERESVDRDASLQWLRTGIIYPETEGFMIGIQDNVINTRNHQKYILKQNIDSDKCRKCNIQKETVEHIISACRCLANSKYLERHNKVAAIVYKELLRTHKLNNDTNTPYYKLQPQPLVENERVKIYWDKTLLTDRRVEHNRPDITIVDKIQKKAYFDDISVPNNNNMDAKIKEKMEKYEPLTRDIKQVWQLESVETIPIIVSAMGLIPTNLKKNLRKIGVPENIYQEMQKSVILDTTHIVRSFLQM